MMNIFKSVLQLNRHPKITKLEFELNRKFYCTKKNLVKYVYQFWRNKFSENKISEPSESIKNIIAHAVSSNKLSDVHNKFNTVLSEKQMEDIQLMCEKRLKSIPVQYVLGEWQFRDLTLKMKMPVFIPRPETEMFVEIVLQDIPEKNTNILELCCGSGAISVSILKNRSRAFITAVDKNPLACDLTYENAELYHVTDRLKIVSHDLCDTNILRNLDDKFDVIVSNPPYVLEKDMETLQLEIKLYEDLTALRGGYDGMDVIKPILFVASRKLVSKGKLFLEVDPSHPDKINEYLRENKNFNLRFVETFKDFCKKDRFVLVEKI